jgi:hypothetical protein
MECHYHVGRAAVHKQDCTMRNLEAMKGKDVTEAEELWEQLTDSPLTDDSIFSFSPHAEVFETQILTNPCSAQGWGSLHSAPRQEREQSVLHREARPIYIEEEKYSPKFSTIFECGTSPDPSDEGCDDINFSTTSSSEPSMEEKKLASIIVVPNNTPTVCSPLEVDIPSCSAWPLLYDTIMHSDPWPASPEPDGSAPSPPELEASPDHGLRKKKYIVFSSHSVQGRRKTETLFTRLMLTMHIASKREVILHNEESGYVTDNVLTLAQKQIEAVKYFWQDWHSEDPKAIQDSISLFAGTFTHADYAEVFEGLAEFILTNPAFTKTQSKLLGFGHVLRDTVGLRVLQLIADHPQHHAFCSQQRVLSDTITFINNQLLLRGLIDEARKPRQYAPALVDFRKGAVSKTSLSPARHSKFSARQPLLTHCMGSTAPSV